MEVNTKENSIRCLEDVKSFLDCHVKSRHESGFIYYIEKDSNSLISQPFNIGFYKKIQELGKLLVCKYKESTNPLNAYDLRTNNFADLVDAITCTDYSIADVCGNAFYFENERIPDDAVLNFNDLIQRIRRIEECEALCKQKVDGYSYRYILGENESQVDILKKAKSAWDDFKDVANEFSEKYYFVDVEIENRENIEFFPRVVIYVHGRPYVVFEQSNITIEHSDYRERAIYRITESFYSSLSPNKGQIEYYNQKSKFLPNRYSSVKEALSFLFSMPRSSSKAIGNIKSEFERVFWKHSNEIKVCYDWVTKSYFFDQESELLFFDKYVDTDSTDKLYYKYTSMTTLIAVIDSKRMRLNTIVAMNDHTEVSKLEGEGCNFSEMEKGIEAIQRYANYYFITSFTNLRDNLNMWRFYGNNAEGVCMVFEPIAGSEYSVSDVTYIKSYSRLLNKIQAFLLALKQMGIRFRIASFVSRLLFIKPDGFKSEKERRLVIPTNEPTDYVLYPNNVLVPYLEKKLPASKNEYYQNPKEYYPLLLKEVILGPAMPNKEDCKNQLRLMIDNKLPEYEKIGVRFSKIDYYRN